MGRDPIKSDRKGFCLGSEIVAEIAVRKIVTVVSAAKFVNHVCKHVLIGCASI